MNRRHLFDVLAIAALVILAALSLRCGGDEFGTGPALAGDAGTLLEASAPELDALASPGDANTLGELEQLGEAQAEASDSRDAQGVEDAQAEHDAGREAQALDAGVDALDHQDAGGDAGELLEAGPSLCCHIACGSGTLGPGAGWTCSGPCVVGAACSFMGACGVVAVCQ